MLNTADIKKIKYGNNNGSRNSTAQYWWNGSSTYSSSGAIGWCGVSDQGKVGNFATSISMGLAPAWAM